MILIIDTSDKMAIVAKKSKSEIKKEEWEAGRELSATILDRIDSLFETDECLKDIRGIIVNAGPGSYTGLRIGLSVANALAYSLNIPIVGISEVKNFEDLALQGLKEIKSKDAFEKSIIPFYGSEPNITQPKNSK